MNAVKEEAKKLIDEMPEEATWDDIMYQFYVRKKIEAGLRDADEGKTTSHEEVKRRYGVA